jgi:hypothetical protein
MLNHGLYTGTLWTVPATFVDTSGDAVDLSGIDYVATVVLDGTTVFTFRSTGAASNEGTIDTSAAATGVLTFNATVTQHAAVLANLYRFHLVRDLTDDIWAAEATLLIGEPGDLETYLKFDRTVGASVELPILVIGGGGADPMFPFDAGFSSTDYFGLQAFDFGSSAGPAGATYDLGSSS